MKSLQLRSRAAWAAPVMLVLPFLMGADGKGCQAGGPIPIGSGDNGGTVGEGGSGGDDGGEVADGASRADAGSVCTPASCAGLAAPAEVCPDGTTLTASVCEEQRPGQCGWGFPACPADACVAYALPCVPCPFGTVGIGKDANGCDTCPICAPPSDAGAKVDACPAAPICNLPNCMYGVIARMDANGCDLCPACASAPDAGSCQCGPMPPVVGCPGGGSVTISCEQTSTKSCSWVVGACPVPGDDGGLECTGDADCPSGKVCGFLESNACGAAGSCFPAPTVICNAYSPGCACDGSEVDVICNGLPTGYARKAIKHPGACVDGG